LLFSGQFFPPQSKMPSLTPMVVTVIFPLGFLQLPYNLFRRFQVHPLMLPSGG